jgi:hypothetical protein
MRSPDRMHMHISVDCTNAIGDEAAPVRVGWLLNETHGGVLFDAPTRVRSAPSKSSHAKSASKCPAIIGCESRLFEICCPYDLVVEFDRDSEGIGFLRDGNGASSGVRELDRVLVLTQEHEWRCPERPLIQIPLPYIFVADEPVYLTQLPPFLHYQKHSLPGIMLAGRFPIHIWPRPLMWAFEWHDPAEPLVLRRGDPLFYVQMETMPPSRAVQLVEAEATDALMEYIDQLSGVVNYVNQTFSLFETAQRRRPARLLTPTSE